MAMTQDTIVVATFERDSQARKAIEDLRRAGYNDNEIGVLARAGTIETGDTVASDAVTGVAGGGLVGGVLGAAASLLIPGFGPVLAGGVLAGMLSGATVGAATGGLVGILAGMGVPEREARFYQHEMAKGHTVVTVKASTDLEDAATILHNDGALQVHTRFSAFNAVPPQRPYGAPPETYDPTAGRGESRE